VHASHQLLLVASCYQDVLAEYFVRRGRVEVCEACFCLAGVTTFHAFRRSGDEALFVERRKTARKIGVGNNAGK